jgi:hypothetical protein
MRTKSNHELALLVPALTTAALRQLRRANVNRLTHRPPMPADRSQDEMTSCFLQREQQFRSHQSKSTRCFLRARPEAKQEGASGRYGSKKHKSEKREGLVKTLPFPCHRVFAVGRGPEGGGEEVGKAAFKIRMLWLQY